MQYYEALSNNEAACGSQRIEWAGDEKQLMSLQWPNLYVIYSCLAGLVCTCGMCIVFISNDGTITLIP